MLLAGDWPANAARHELTPLSDAILGWKLWCRRVSDAHRTAGRRPDASASSPRPRSSVTFYCPATVVSLRVLLNDLEDELNKSIAFAITALALLAGCGPENSGIPVKPKFQGPPYHLALAAPPAKASKAGVTIPPIKYTADANAPQDALDTRAILVLRVDTSSVKGKGPMTMDQIIMGAVDIPGTDGTLPAEYMDATDQSLATLLEEYCVKGKLKVTVALTRSSLSSTAGDAEIDSKLLTTWLPIDLVFKNPQPGC